MTNDRVAILIKKVALVIEKLSNPILAPYELTHSQYKILKFLCQNQNQPIRQTDIEKLFSMTNPTVTGILQNLEKKGLVVRIQNPDDKRSKLLMLTERAAPMKDELKLIGESLERQVTENLTEEEKGQLIALLNKILKNECQKIGGNEND